jgi:hypothetical protein
VKFHVFVFRIKIHCCLSVTASEDQNAPVFRVVVQQIGNTVDCLEEVQDAMGHEQHVMEGSVTLHRNL